MTKQQQINIEASRLVNAYKRGDELPSTSDAAKAKARLQVKLERLWPRFKLPWYDDSI